MFMTELLVPLSLVSMTASGAALRAIWIIALAAAALAAIDRMKPATPRRPIAVRVDQKPTPLYREPDRNHRIRALLQLSGGALVLGALIACITGFMVAVALEFVGGLLRS